MCQLFGLNSAKPIAPHFSLRGFFRRGGATDEHADGWGLAYFSGGSNSDDAHSYLQVRETAAAQCVDALAVLKTPFKSNNVIAHVRKATIGAVAVRNNHPFIRRLWGRDWVFAHNGDLKQFNPIVYPGFAPVGETDSEHAFCYLLGSLQERYGDQPPSDDALLAHVRTVSAAISRRGSFNFLLSDGRVMFAHCSTSLHWTLRTSTVGQVELLDDALTINFQDHNGPDDQMVVVATKPLTRGESWQAMESGELKLFADGVELESVRTRHSCGPITGAAGSEQQTARRPVEKPELLI